MTTWISRGRPAPPPDYSTAAARSLPGAHCRSAVPSESGWTVPLRPSYPIRTARLLLRPLRASDTPDLVAYRSRAGGLPLGAVRAHERRDHRQPAAGSLGG